MPGLSASTVFWIFIFTLAFNAYTSVQKWPTTDPTLLMVNGIALFSMIIISIYRILVYICSRKTKLDVISSASKQRQKLSESEWIDEFEQLAKRLSQNTLTRKTHAKECNCLQHCFHVSMPCTVTVADTKPRKSYTTLTLSQHAPKCNCKCFTDYHEESE